VPSAGLVETSAHRGDVMRTAKPALNIYIAPNSGFEFAFHTEDGKISAVISVARPAGADIRTIAEKEREALLKLKRLAKALDHAVAEMILS
jgi:hypothetical protein